MNWTGGRLKCHARSFGNKGIRAQRGHFARQKRDTHLRSTQGAPFSSHTRAIEPRDAPFQDRRDTLFDLTASPKQPDYSHEHFLRNKTETSSDHKETVKKSADYMITRSRISNPDGREDTLVGRDGNVPASRGVSVSMEDMKKRLLAQSDWLGLSPHRPARIDFPSMTSVAEIGRHRKIKDFAGSGAKPRLSSHDNQVQRNAKTVIGKRKRVDQDEMASDFSLETSDTSHEHSHMQPKRAIPQTLPNPDGRQSDSASQPQAASTELRTPPVDHNRRYYYLSHHNSPLDEITANLVPLHEVRSLKNFDAVRELHLELRKSRYVTNVKETHCETERDFQTGLSESRSRHHTGYKSTKRLNRQSGLTPSGRFTIRTDENVAPSPTLGARSPSTLAAEIADQDLLRSLVGSSKKQQVLQHQQLPFAVDENEDIAIRDFAITTPVRAEAYAPRVAWPDSSHGTERFCLEPVELEVREMPPIFKTNAMAAGRELRESSNLVPCFASDSTLPESRSKFELDAGLEPDNWDVSNFDYDKLFEQRRDLGQSSFSNKISPPHFGHRKSSDEELCESKGESMGSQIPSSLQGSDFKNHSLDRMRLRRIDSRYYRLCPTTSEPSLGESRLNIGHELPHLESAAPKFNRGSQIARAQQEMFAVGSSSPSIHIQRGVPITIFSTPPKQSDGRHVDVNRDDFSPYFRN